MADEPALTVVVPLYRSADTLRELVERIRESLAGLVWELILVDDASPDDAGQIAAAIAREDGRIRLVALAGNRGQQEALREGVRQSRGRRIAFLDADLQDPPEVLPRLLAAAADAELVFGIRQGSYQGLGRRLSSAFYKAIRSRLCRVPPGAGLLLVADGELLRSLAKEAPEPCWWIPLLGSHRPKIEAVPVERRPRPSGRSAYRGLMRWRIGLAELAFALRLRRP